MRKTQIMTDSASDISYEDEQKYGISVIPFPITLGDKTYISRVDFDNQQFYALMAQYDEIPKTSQITPFQFQEIYLQQAQAGVTDLILVLINSKGSSTYDNSVQAIELFYEEYPQYRDAMRIHSIDGSGYNALVRSTGGSRGANVRRWRFRRRNCTVSHGDSAPAADLLRHL